MAEPNAAEVATHEWVRQEIANQPKRMYEAAKVAAANQGSTGAAYLLGALTIILFIVGSIYTGLLLTDLQNESQTASRSDWKQAKWGRLSVVVAPVICFGFICMAIMIGLLVSSDIFVLQNKNRIAFAMAVFALLTSILIYSITIQTRTLGGGA